MSNPANLVTLTGRLAGDPVLRNNSDGSATALFTLFVQRNYANRGEYLSDRIPLQARVNNPGNPKNPFAIMRAGDLVQVSGAVESFVQNAGTDNPVYRTVIVVDTVLFTETANQRQERRMRKATRQATAQQQPIQPQQMPVQQPAVQQPVAQPQPVWDQDATLVPAGQDPLPPF